MNRPVHHEESGGMERWLLTYSDMITLLLVLFIVLYAISSLNHTKYAAFRRGIATSFNNGPSQPSTAHTVKTPTLGKHIAFHQASLVKIEHQLEKALTKAGLIKDVRISNGPLGLSVGLVTGKTFYSVDSAALSPLGARIVDVAASVLHKYNNLISVNGYTDNERIISGPFQNNWQLSAQRAVNVVTQLQVEKVSPKLLYAVGFGQYHPTVPNSSPKNQAKNRRVDVVISPPGQRATIP